MRKVVISGLDTSTLPTLSHEQSAELLKKIRCGDEDARAYFIKANLKLVLSLVQRYSSRVENPDDVFQMGCVGLVKAVDNFDDSYGVRFSTYAVPLIVGEMRRFIRESNSLRISRSVRDVAYHALATREKLERQNTSEVSVEQIASEMDLPPERISYCLNAISDVVSLSSNVYSTEEDCLTLMDQISDDKVSENAWIADVDLSRALNVLGEREYSVIEKRYFQGKTQTEVSKEIGISQAQVSRLEKNAVNTLRQSMS